jgi:uncharacterized protein YdiU (UPF0061 family)
MAAGLISEDQAADGVVAYGEELTARYNGGMARKMGLKRHDQELAIALQREMLEDAADFTNTFRALSAVGTEGGGGGGDDGAMPPALAAAIGEEALGAPGRADAWAAFLRAYRAALRAQGWAGGDAERRAVQDAANPALVPRNHVLVAVIGAAEGGDFAPLERLMDALRRPYQAAGVDPAWTEPAPARSRLGVELLSCSS